MHVKHKKCGSLLVTVGELVCTLKSKVLTFAMKGKR